MTAFSSSKSERCSGLNTKSADKDSSHGAGFLDRHGAVPLAEGRRVDHGQFFEINHACRLSKLLGYFSDCVSARPRATRPVATKRQTPKPSFRIKVEITATKITLVSLRAETMAIGAWASAQMMIQ
jgi:hypothetical protein